MDNAISIRDLKPGLKNINLLFIVIEVGKRKDARN